MHTVKYGALGGAVAWLAWWLLDGEPWQFWGGMGLFTLALLCELRDVLAMSQRTWEWQDAAWDAKQEEGNAEAPQHAEAGPP